jgi:hypothetical protein
MANDTVRNLALKGATMAGKMVANKIGINPNIVDTATNLATNYLNKQAVPIEGQGFVKGTASAKKHAQLMRANQSNKKHFVKG